MSRLHTIREIREWARCCARLHLERLALGATAFEQIDVDVDGRDCTIYAYVPGGECVTSGYTSAMPLDELAVRELKDILLKRHNSPCISMA